MANEGIQIGANASTGTNIGRYATDKIGLYGVTPVAQASAITAPTTTGADTASVAALKTAVDAIRTALKNIGVTA
jgi:hypothetical protein